MARDIRKTVTTIEDLLAELDKTLCNYMDPATEGLIFPPLATLAAAQAALTALRAELRPRLDALTAMGSRSSRNAVKAHIEYSNELTRLWLKHVPNAAGRRFWRRHLRRFLTESSLLIFPSEITAEAKLKAFVGRVSSQTGT